MVHVSTLPSSLAGVGGWNITNIAAFFILPREFHPRPGPFTMAGSVGKKHWPVPLKSVGRYRRNRPSCLLSVQSRESFVAGTLGLLVTVIRAAAPNRAASLGVRFNRHGRTPFFSDFVSYPVTSDFLNYLGHLDI